MVTETLLEFGTSIGIAVDWRSGIYLVMTLVATISVIIFFIL